MSTATSHQKTSHTPRTPVKQDQGSTRSNQGSAKQDKSAKPADQAKQQAIQDAQRPGPEHAELAKGVGTWQVGVTMWVNGEAKRSQGTSRIVSEFDDRYTREEFTGEYQGQPFRGVGYLGFDRAAKRYVSTWHDNMGTGIVYTSGPAVAEGQDLELSGEMTCPINGPMTLRQVHHQESADHCTITMYNVVDGKETKSMELDYQRQR